MDSSHLNPLLLGYLLFLGGGALCAFHWIWRRRSALQTSGLTELPVPATDFMVLLWCLVLVVLASNWVLGRVGSGEGQTMEIWAALISGVMLQGGMLAAFLIFWSGLRGRSSESGRSRSSGQGWLRSLRFGVVGFLAILPIVWGVGAVWTMFLTMMRSLGWEVSTDPQPLVDLLRHSEEPFAVAGLVVLAVVLAPLAEECVFRGAIYRFLRARSTRGFAMAMTAVLFAFLHLNTLGFPGLVVVGLGLCLAYEVTGDLRVPITLHACFNLNSVILLWLQ